MDRKQFICYVEGNQRQLRRYLVALCRGNTQLAEDIAQETYIKAYLSSDSFHDVTKFKAWIYKIAYNTFLNFCRERKMSEELDAAEKLSANHDYEGPFKYQELYLALDSLSDVERNVILLFYLQGYSSKEIASIMELSDDNVRQLLSRSRKNLKSLLKNII